MIVAALKDYLPFHDLLEIVVVCMLVAVVAPSAVAVAIVGLDRRSSAAGRGESQVVGDALIVAGVVILAVLIGLGLYTLFEK
jgi:hypothetical protein